MLLLRPLATSTQQPCAPRWCTAKGVRVLSRARRAPALPCPRARRVPRSQRARQRRRRRAMVRRRLTGLGCSSLVCLSLCLTERHRVMRAPIRLQPRTGLVGRTVERGGRLAARGRVDRERAAARARVPRRQVWRAILREEARLEDQVQRVVLQGQRACVGKGKAKRSAPFFWIWWHGPPGPGRGAGATARTCALGAARCGIRACCRVPCSSKGRPEAPRRRACFALPPNTCVKVVGEHACFARNRAAPDAGADARC